MADISVSDVNGSSGGSMLSRTMMAFIGAFVLTLGLHWFAGTQLGPIYVWVATAVIFAGASYFVAQGGDDSAAPSIDDKDLMDLRGQKEAISRSQAVIEFTTEGIIIAANKNFLDAMGYSLLEVQGKHHSIFVTPEYAASPEYKAFWAKLGRGEFEAGEFHRIAKDGSDIWIQASYNAIMDENGVPFKVVKYATDITEQKKVRADYAGQIRAISASQAVIEFKMDGTIITANENFCGAMGYALEEIQGKHHSMFAEPELAASAEYKAFWEKLNRGEFDAGEFKRLGKGGKEIWIQASYNPILDLNGNPFKVVKYATDVTEEKLRNADFSGQIEAVGKSQAVIEFNMDGTIITANENFCGAMGYALEEIQGKHHSMFAEPELAASAEYKAFWEKLNRGEFESGEFKRVGKGGREIWIQASYNPILDLNGNPFKVVKYATDITEEKLRNADFSGQIEAVGKSQAVIEFNMDGTIITANENFCGAMGYALEEIQGKHHSMFADPELAASAEYKAFWEKLNRGEFDAGEFKRLGKGGKEIWIQASYNPILDMNGKPFKVVKFATDITAQVLEAAQNAQNARIKVALDSATANIMLADNDFNIFYMNDSMMKMMKVAEQDLKKVLTAFDADSLIGTNIDVFHKDPSHQRRLIGALSDTFSTEITVGARKFTLIANPVVDINGERFGTSVEWADVTQERGVEAEINDVVDAAVAGDLTQRVDLEGKKGFMLNVSKGINSFAETCEAGLNDVASMLESLAAGDLTARITNDYQGTFDELKQNSNSTAEKLSEVLSEIAMGAGEVSNAATEISSGSSDLSQRTEQQASSLEETAASMEEMESAVKANADNANEANKQGGSARDVAEKGGDVVNNAVDAMSRIEDSSQKISDIIVVIDEIAFQTNLLALNAAVEAARAGDAGKGFAVVASEVRALAQRSSEAAKDIKALIVDSNNQVKGGVELVNEAGEQLAEIVTSIKSVTDLVSEIAAANQEQATGIAEINKAIAEMDEMTQQNSALVEETAASARTLEEQSEVMQDRVSFFNTGEEATKYTPTAKPAAAARRASKPQAAPAPAAADDDDWAEF
jgi:methyl-accepting chemotaxis protein